MEMEMEFYTWKVEPDSPVGPVLHEESWLQLEDEEARLPALKNEQLEDVWLPVSPSASNCSETSQLYPLSPAARAELAAKLLTDLEQDDDDNSLDWFEQKTDLPIFDDLPSPPTPVTSPTHDCSMAFAPMTVSHAYHITQQPLPVQTVPVQTVPVHSVAVHSVAVPMASKREMYGTMALPMNVPLSHDVVTLMPNQVVPQLVPHPVEHTNDTASLLQEFENVYDETVLTFGALTPPQSPPGAPVLYELQNASPRPSKGEMILPHSTDLTELDEIVRARAEETAFGGPLDPASPRSISSLSSPSASPSPSLESSDDPDWVPSPAAAPCTSTAVARGRGRKKGSSTKPYARVTQEDKKLRKKEQNKNAATRYRLKKKMEVEEILGEEQELQDTHDHLTQKVAELSQEIRYLKDLMREVCRAKGLIK